MLLNIIKEHKFITFIIVFVLLSILTIALVKFYAINSYKNNEPKS